MQLLAYANATQMICGTNEARTLKAKVSHRLLIILQHSPITSTANALLKNHASTGNG